MSRPALAALLTCTLLAGCAVGKFDAAEYQQRANATFQRSQVQDALGRKMAARHPQIEAAGRAAFRQNRVITNPRLITEVAARLPNPNGRTEVWVLALMVDRKGHVVDSIFDTYTGKTLDPNAVSYVQKRVKGWRFEPARFDGQAEDFVFLVDIVTDGKTTVGLLPKT